MRNDRDGQSVGSRVVENTTFGVSGKLHAYEKARVCRSEVFCSHGCLSRYAVHATAGNVSE